MMTFYSNGDMSLYSTDTDQTFYRHRPKVKDEKIMSDGPVLNKNKRDQ
jgi:hypothetical protein